MFVLFAAALVYVGALTDSSATLVWGDPTLPGNSIDRAGSGLLKSEDREDLEMATEYPETAPTEAEGKE